MTEEEIVELIKKYYLEENLNQIQTAEKIGISKYKLQRLVGQYGLRKSKKQYAEQCKKAAQRTKEQQEIINEKRKQTCLKKYGVEYNWQSEETKEKSKETLRKKYGTDKLRDIKEINDKRKQTCIERYGGESPFHSKEIQDKATQTLCERYGRRSSTTQLSETAIKAFTSRENFRDFLLSIPEEERTLYEIEKRLGYSGTLFYKYYHLYNLENIPYKTMNHSTYEEEICDILKDLNVNYIIGERKILCGREIDIYLPDFKVGLEFNGTYWHDDEHKEKSYHQEKSLEAKKKGVFLYHIWEHEWKDPIKKDIIISQIKNLAHLSTPIYARKTEIREIAAKDCHKFLDENHLQGFRAAQHYYGLYYNNELVSCMTFGLNYLGKNKKIELLRFCNKKGYSVIGGASKLFKYFLRQFPECNEIISYCNLAKGSGKLYLNLGMTFKEVTSPNYVWVHQGKLDVVSRYSAQMKNEDSIMREKNYLKNYDCGNLKFVWTRNI